MDSAYILPMVARWVHIASAMAAIGGPFFIRFGLMPAAGRVLDDATHQKLRETINARWKHVVYLLITLFILTGTYNFLVETRVDGKLITARWKDFGPEDKRLYHMLFGIKTLAAFVIFFLASALTGRAAAFAVLRKNAKTTTLILLLVAAVLLICSTMMRYLPMKGIGPLP